MPEGKCRRPHRQHETIYLFAARSSIRSAPRLRSAPSGIQQRKASGAEALFPFPEELPRRCIEACGRLGEDVIVLDPFSGSGTTAWRRGSLAARTSVSRSITKQVVAANERLARI